MCIRDSQEADHAAVGSGCRVGFGGAAHLGALAERLLDAVVRVVAEQLRLEKALDVLESKATISAKA